jgi:hypothetical protein
MRLGRSGALLYGSKLKGIEVGLKGSKGMGEF